MISEVTRCLHLQEDLYSIPAGNLSLFNPVRDRIVLEAPWIFTKPPPTAPTTDLMRYAIDTLFTNEDIAQERAILRTIQQYPHVNIVQAIALAYPGGIYLRRYTPLSKFNQIDKSVRPVRLLWYRDILRALQHLHHFHIAHADVRATNLLLDSEHRIVLYDFARATYFGGRNPSGPSGEPPFEEGSYGANGLVKTDSEATDKFALASFIYEMEIGHRPKFKYPASLLICPSVNTGDHILDETIQNGWKYRFESTAAMLGALEARIQSVGTDAAELPTIETRSSDIMCSEVESWRSQRLEQYGMSRPTDRCRE
ncbi:MAG: hypothetical protein Q9178_006028 [Gyalolechia marmorata]